MNSNSKATSRQSKNSRIQAGQTSLVSAVANTSNVGSQQNTSRFDAVVRRLWTSQVEYDDLLELVGYKDGSNWAECKATVPEVGRLRQAMGPLGDDWYSAIEDTVYSDAESFFFIIRPDFDGDSTAAADFWKTVTGDPELPESAYVGAFVLGAAKIWDEFAVEVQPGN